MGKNAWYSKPLNFFWHKFYGQQKKLTPELTDEEIYHVLKQNLISSPIRNGETVASRDLILSGLELWKVDSKGKLLHIFFLDGHLRTFLEEMPLSDIDGIKKYLYENGENKVIKYINTGGNSNSVIYSFGLHLPYETEGYAFSISIEENGSVEIYFSHGEFGGCMSDKFYSDLNKQDDLTSLTQTKMFRLAINTIAYMNCFPECVTDGVPKNLFERGEDKTVRNFTFQVSDKINDIDIQKQTRIPHFRKGHFRLLQSDYFVNKQGQLTFISETMVKGKAKTVSTSPEIETYKVDKENNSN